jgi:hypothetical protein
MDNDYIIDYIDSIDSIDCFRIENDNRIEMMSQRFNAKLSKRQKEKAACGVLHRFNHGCSNLI